MALENFYDAVILFGAYDYSADHNEVRVERKVDPLEFTRFGHTNHVFKSGLRSDEVSGKGWLNIDDSTTPVAADKSLFDSIAAAAKPMTISSASADGSIAYLLQGVSSDYSWTMKNDALGQFDFAVKCGGDGAVRGRLVLPLATYSASAVGSIYELGAVSATQKVYAALHVTEWNATSLDVLVKSNDTNDTVTPTTRITFTQATAVTSEWKSLAGAITDTYWYVDFTLVGTSAKFSVSVGIR